MRKRLRSILPNADKKNTYQTQKSLLLDGVNDYGEITYDSDLIFTNEISCGFWIRLGLLNSGVILSQYETSGDNRAFDIGIVSNSRLVETIISPDGALNTLTYKRYRWPVLEPNINYFLTMVYGNDEIKLYVNGIQVTPTTANNNSFLEMFQSTVNWKLGAYSVAGSPSAFLSNAYVDELSLWKYVLSDDDVNELYNNGKHFDVNTHSKASQGLKLYYPIVATDTSTLIEDKSIYFGQHNAVINNADSTIFKDIPIYGTDPGYYSHNSLLLDGINDYAITADHTDFAFDTAMSAGFWAMKTGDDLDTGTNFLLTQYDSGGGQISFDISRVIDTSFNVDSFQVKFYNGSSSLKQYRLSIKLEKDVPIFFTMTFAANDLRIYANGVEDTSVIKVKDLTCNAIFNSTANLVVGSGYSSGNPVNFLQNLYIDQLSLWNITLTPAEIIELYNNGQHKNANEHSRAGAGLVSFWRMGESLNFPTIYDSSNFYSRHDLTLTNATEDVITTTVIEG